MQTATAPTKRPALALDDLFPVDALAQAFPQFLTLPTLRWQLRHRDTNGLAPACVRIGKKLLISRARYEAWLDSQTREAA
jgi:hypothetical protein